MSTVEGVDEDLRDVFKLLYQEDESDDWAFSDDDEAQSRSLDVLSPSSEVNRVDDGLLCTTKTRYTRKRYQDALDSLIDHSQTKKPRIYAPSPSSSARSSSLITSTTPFPSLPPLELYAPFSPLPLLARLRTYARNSFVDFGLPLDAITLAKDGWTCQDREVIQCAQCGGTVSLSGIVDIKDVAVRKEVVKRIGKAVKGKHLDGCPWRIKACPDDLIDRLRKMLHPIISSSLATLAQRLRQDCPALASIRIHSLLTDEQSQTLSRSLGKHTQTSGVVEGDSGLESNTTAATLALFGWFPYYPNSVSTHIDLSVPSQATEIVHCRICQRRVGLWGFKDTDKRPFDILTEHLTWCPIRSGQWWTEISLLASSGKDQKKVEKGWVTLSDKLEKKKWRRV